MTERASPTLVLASASPRRAAILRRMGLDFDVLPAGVDESRIEGEPPPAFVERLARAKAEAVADRGRSRELSGEAGGGGETAVPLVIGGDTIVVLGGQLLGKPATVEEAVGMLTAMAGRTHTVLTAVAVAERAGGRTRTESAVVETRVRFRPFGEELARAYVATGEPMDKAGAYGVQRLGAALVERVEGDFYSVMGLPVVTLVSLLERLGWRYAFGRLER